MTPIEIIGQIISCFAMVCNILSYQQKSESRLIACQMAGGALFSVSFFMLGATLGGILNLIAALRGILFLFSEKTRATHPAWLGAFVTCYVALYALTFTVFGVAPTPIALAIEALVVRFGLKGR